MRVVCVNCRHYRRRHKGERDVCLSPRTKPDHVHGGEETLDPLLCVYRNWNGECHLYKPKEAKAK